MDEKQQLYTEILVIRSQQGEKEAFELLVELWQKPLLTFALRYLKQESEALDAVQETWITVIKKLKKLKETSLFTSWLFRILTNKCIDRIRKKQNEEKLINNANPKSETSKTTYENEDLEQALQKLPDEHKTLIIMRFGQGLQVGQIAALLNIAEGTVKSRLHRALARLREMLGEIT
ncbi:MAG: RNA polymerase sigma factor [Sedimentisphaerales bacterium]|nr:RNA polymerase sigma factor [Sedimentisphaerales bacterium]